MSDLEEAFKANIKLLVNKAVEEERSRILELIESKKFDWTIDDIITDIEEGFHRADSIDVYPRPY